MGPGGWGDVEETRRYGGRATSAHTTGIYPEKYFNIYVCLGVCMYDVYNV
jgi:hypothetical protein